MNFLDKSQAANFAGSSPLNQREMRAWTMAGAERLPRQRKQPNRPSAQPWSSCRRPAMPGIQPNPAWKQPKQAAKQPSWALKQPRQREI